VADVCPDCGRPKATSGEDWSAAYYTARADEVSAVCGRHLPSYWSDESIPDCDQATIKRLRAENAALRKVATWADEVAGWETTAPPAAVNELRAALAELAKLDGGK
jgi:hypothetical protein